MTGRQLLYRGSTKDIYELNAEECLFKFSDRYSIFDWGEMPDPIKGKGESTAELTNYIYGHFEKELGCATHLLNKGPAKDELVVRRFQVPRNQNITEFYMARPPMAFVPLEVIFRLGVPKGSSLIERGLYAEGHLFSKPMIEFSTKLENTDRMLTETEAQNIAGMNRDEFQKLQSLATHLALNLKSLVEKNGFALWDGKFEFAFIPGTAPEMREFMLVDSISLDELRLTLDGFPLSKEILRQIYKHSSWYQELKNLKIKSPLHFRKECSPPTFLTPTTLALLQNIYHYTQKTLMSECDNDTENYKDKLQASITEIKNEHPYLR